MKVVDSVLCFKTTKHASIINGVGCTGINNLKLKFILKAPPPLSPPSLIHTSLPGITPSCHVRVPSLLKELTLVHTTALQCNVSGCTSICSRICHLSKSVTEITCVGLNVVPFIDTQPLVVQ